MELQYLSVFVSRVLQLPINMHVSCTLHEKISLYKDPGYSFGAMETYHVKGRIL